MQQSIPFSYDTIPYDSQPIGRTNPAQLSAIARLFSVPSKPGDHARVLELGCASGHNLFGLATAFPKSEFIGIDLSSVQIEAGNKTLAAIGLENVSLLQLNICDIDESLGTFDYIICHGLFSWVPERVREKILSIFRTHLNPHGIAYLSYNSFPGWHTRSAVRDVLLYQAKHHHEPHQKIRAARQFGEFLLKAIAKNPSYSSLFKEELAQAVRMPDWYLFHDYLAEVNQPFYFSEITTLATDAQLQYLCDAEIAKTLPQEFSPEVQQHIRSLPMNRLEREQYVDFLRYRMFRRSLFVHRDEKLTYTLEPAIVKDFAISSSLQTPNLDPASLRSAEELRFTSSNGGAIALRDPVSKAAVYYLTTKGVRSVPYSELSDYARSEMGDAYSAKKESVLCASLLRGFLAGLLDFSFLEFPSSEAINVMTPRTTPLARFHAQTNSTVVNLNNEMVSVSEFERSLLSLLDGTRDTLNLIAAMKATFESRPGSEFEDQAIEQHVQQSLQRFTTSALLLP